MPESSPGLAVCWGEVLWDLFPSGACLGGAPSNLAVHLARVGVPASLITRVGDDELGTDAKNELRLRGVDTTGVQTDLEMSTGRVGITLESGEPRYTLHPGAWQRIACDDRAIALLQRARVFAFGTLSQESEAGMESFRAALRHLPVDTIRFCDPNLRGGRIDPALVREHFREATHVKINDDEAQVLEATYGCDDAVEWLLDEMDVHLVARTLGPAGCELHSPGGSSRQAGFPAAADGDNVGAGDAFGAVLIAGVLAGASLERIAEAANRYGSFVASSRGATPAPSEALLEDVRSLLGAH